LQGALFRRFRDVLLGYKHIDTLAADLASFLQPVPPLTVFPVLVSETESATTSTPDLETEITMNVPPEPITINVPPITVEEHVGNSRSDGDVTDEIDADGFITVKTKREKREIKRSNTVERNRIENNGKIVSRAILLNPVNRTTFDRLVPVFQ
jgi:hypothetical protein